MHANVEWQDGNLKTSRVAFPMIERLKLCDFDRIDPNLDRSFDTHFFQRE